MSCIIIVYNGDWDIITASDSVIITCHEEWNFYFECVLGRTITKQKGEANKNYFKMNNLYLRIRFDSKLIIVLRDKNLANTLFT